MIHDLSLSLSLDRNGNPEASITTRGATRREIWDDDPNVPCLYPILPPRHHRSTRAFLPPRPRCSRRRRRHPPLISARRAVRGSSVPPSFHDAAAARYVALYYLRRNSRIVVARRDVLVSHTSILSIWASRACSLRTCTSLWVAPLGVMAIATGRNRDRYFIHISKSIRIFVIYSFVVIWVIISCK